MKILNFCTSVIFCCMMITFSSCSTPPINDGTMNNFSHRGFINNDCFQAVISESPDRDSGGMVEQRESAYLKAKVKCPETALNSMAEYICLKGNSERETERQAGNTIGESPHPALSRQLRELLAFGYIAEEYYRDDNTVILVYRIRKTGLKKKIDSMNCLQETAEKNK